MNTSPPSRFLFPVALIFSMGAAATAQADPLYHATALGSGYQFGQDADGTIHSVTGVDGRQFSFEKAPVTEIDSAQTLLSPTSAHADRYTQWTLQDGSYRVGYAHDSGGALPFPINFPTFAPVLGGWGVGSSDEASAPVADLNIKGQVVGTSLNFPKGDGSAYAAFSAEGLQVHNAFTPDNSDFVRMGDDFGSAAVDNLNHYVTGDTGWNLTSAVKIDDNGRIIAWGELDGDKQAFLLTPELQPTPTPEPTTLALMGVVGIVCGARSAYRRRRAAKRA